ncbi:MAG: DUF58 domain-containing protein [Bacteroidota bacterium]
MPINQQELQQFGNLEFVARQVVEGFITGLHKSPFHGFSVEFAEHRAYNAGEPTKHIDWKLYARSEKLFVKRFEEETNLRCQIVIDSSSSMYFPHHDPGAEVNSNKITFSVYCAAAIMYLLKKQRDAVGLSIFAESVDTQTRAKSSSVHHKMIYQELGKLLQNDHSPAKMRRTFAAESLHRIAENIHKRSLVIIFSDMMDNSDVETDDIFSALQHLRHNKHEVVLFHVVDKQKELDFEFENRPYRFVDMESGEQVKVHPNEVKETYIRSIDRYKKELMLKCGQYKIDFVEADINMGFKQVLLPYLIKRSKLY